MAEPAPFSNLQTPEQIALNRKLGQQLMMQGMGVDPVGHWTQGLARVLQAGVGRMHMADADNQQQQRTQAMMGALQRSPTFAGLSPDDRAMMGMDPDMMRAILPKIYAQKLDPMTGLKRQALEQDIRFKREMRPYQLYSEYQQQQLRDKQLQDPKFGAFKEGDIPYVRDPTAPGGIRFIEPPRGMAGDKDFLKEAAKTQAQRYDDIIKHGEKQNIVMGDLDRMRDLNTVIGNPNAMNQFIMKHGAWLKSVGIQPERMKAMELFESIVSRMAPQMRIPGSGATSDRDLEGFKASLPALMQTEDGRRLIIEQNRMIAQHAMKARDIASRVLTGEVPRAEGERMLRALPDPFALWKSTKGQVGDLGQTKEVVRVTSPDEAAKLPKGTRFIGHDGIERIRN